MLLSHRGIRVSTRGIIVANDLEVLQYSNISGEDQYSLLEGSFGSNTSILEVPLELSSFLYVAHI